MLFNALHVIVTKRWRRGIFQQVTHTEQNMKLQPPSNPRCLDVHIKMPSRAFIKLGRLFTQVAPTFMSLGPKLLGNNVKWRSIGKALTRRSFYQGSDKLF